MPGLHVHRGASYRTLAPLVAVLITAGCTAPPIDRPAAPAPVPGVTAPPPEPFAGDPATWAAAARAQLADGRARDALAAVERAAAVPALAPPDLRVLEGRARLALGEVAAGERLLREELATGAEPAAAALALAAWLESQELFGESLAVLAAGRRRARGDVDLQLAEARAMRDVADFDSAAARLAALLAEHPDESRARLLLAEAEHARGRPQAGLDALAPLFDATADDGWVREARPRLEELRADLRAAAAGGAPQRTPLELLALVRGSDDPLERLRALQALLAVPATRERAMFVGYAQDLAALRVAVVRAFDPAGPLFERRVGAALRDPAPEVRGAAATLLGARGEARVAIALLQDLLRAEEDAYVFRCVHAALVDRLGPLVRLPERGERDAAVRARLRDDWRQVCPE
ncbi:MAG: hypothetical protein IPM29_13900 [Planctomycetes bacterium]|nr:hypothetical protein [Planctomycetota bacterium]